MPEHESTIMSNVLRLAIVDPSDSSRESLKAILLGLEMVWLEAECSRYEFFADVVAQTHPDIGLVVLDNDPDKALRLVEQLSEASPQCSVLVVSGSSDGSLILRAMRPEQRSFCRNRFESRIWCRRWSGFANGGLAAAIFAPAEAT